MKLSVVMPTWNRGNRIQNAIRSIIDQSYADWELIIIDDGSTDSTERVVRDFAHPRIKYHKIDHQNNISKVRNIGNKLATGHVIVVQDSDDVSFPDRLEWIAETFKNDPETDVVYHGIYLSFVDPYTNSVVRKVRHAEDFDRQRLQKEQYISGHVAYRKSVADEIPYNEDIVLLDDLILLLEFAYSNKKFTPIKRNLYEYVGSPDSVNVHGEMDGRRLKDTKKIVEILQSKYGVKDLHATLTKLSDGQLIAEQVV